MDLVEGPEEWAGEVDLRYSQGVLGVAMMVGDWGSSEGGRSRIGIVQTGRICRMGGCVSVIRQKVAMEEERKACRNAYKGLLSIALWAGCVLPQQILQTFQQTYNMAGCADIVSF